MNEIYSPYMLSYALDYFNYYFPPEYKSMVKIDFFSDLMGYYVIRVKSKRPVLVYKAVATLRAAFDSYEEVLNVEKYIER